MKTRLKKIGEDLFLDRKYRGLRRGTGSFDDYFIKKSDILKMARNLGKNITGYLPEYATVSEYKYKEDFLFERQYTKRFTGVKIGCKWYSLSEFKNIIKKVKSIK